MITVMDCHLYNFSGGEVSVRSDSPGCSTLNNSSAVGASSPSNGLEKVSDISDFRMGRHPFHDIQLGVMQIEPLLAVPWVVTRKGSPGGLYAIPGSTKSDCD